MRKDNESGAYFSYLSIPLVGMLSGGWKIANLNEVHEFYEALVADLFSQNDSQIMTTRDVAVPSDAGVDNLRPQAYHQFEADSGRNMCSGGGDFTLEYNLAKNCVKWQ